MKSPNKKQAAQYLLLIWTAALMCVLAAKAYGASEYRLDRVAARSFQKLIH